jgi:nicotinamidase/pyrazinamidase
MRAVFFDIDTQLDFVLPAGALYVPGAEKRIPAIAALNLFAADHSIPVISTTDAHTENDPEFQQWPPHCVAGTLGQKKAAATLLQDSFILTTRAGGVAPPDAQQIIVEKQQLDLFTNPNLPKILEALRPERYVVYGVVTEYCVRCAAMGLLATGNPVELVTDAIETLSAEAAAAMFREFQDAGGTLTSAARIA